MQSCIPKASNAKNPSKVGRIESQQGLSEFGVKEWIEHTLANPRLQWFVVMEAEFDNELSTPKSHHVDTSVPT